LINGVHATIFSDDAEGLRAFFRDVVGLPSVDAGGGWLIFALPPSEIGVHPAEGPTSPSGTHQFSLMCDDIAATVRELRSKGIDVRGEPKDEGWGIRVVLALPGGVEVQLYEPRHAVAAEIAPKGSA
jgi:predicted enzyme related to lactoylglutathione lyase